jgi:hypothetical protein
MVIGVDQGGNMAKLQSDHATVAGQNAAILQALAEAITIAGGNPNVDLIRIANQDGLARKIGRLVVEDLLVWFSYLNNFQINYNKAAFEILESNGWEWLSSSTIQNLLHNVICEAVTLGKETRDGQHFAYDYFKIQRDMTPTEVFERFYRREGTADYPVTMELLLVGELAQNNPVFRSDTSQQLLTPYYILGKYFPLLDTKNKKFSLHDVSTLGLSAGMTIFCYKEPRLAS